MIPTGQIGVPFAAAGWLDLLIYGTCLAGALLVAAAVIEVVRRWLRRGEQPQTPSDQLAHYRSLYRRGEISQEEFDSLRAVLGGEIRTGRQAAGPAARAGRETGRRPTASVPPADGFRPE